MSGRPWADIRQAATDPRRVCDALGLLAGSKAQGGGGLLICCPSPGHGDRSPSCSVRRGPDGTIQVRCFACDFRGDLWGLIGAVTGEHAATRELLVAGAAILGLESMLDESDRGDAAAVPRPAARPAQEAIPAATPRYPSPESVSAFWGSLGPVVEDWDSGIYLEERGIDPSAVARLDLARALSDETELHRGCRWTERAKDGTVLRVWSWDESTHRIVLPVYDAHGVMRSVRGWAVVADVEHCGVPKRLPLAGYAASGLCLASPSAVHLLVTRQLHGDVLVVEGEPDFLTWAIRHSGPVFGVGSGWWTQEHADRIPTGCRVIIRTHCDRAGEAYARQVAESLRKRCRVERLTSKA